MSVETLAFRRLLDRFGTRTQKLGHLRHTGTVQSTVSDGVRVVEISCECGTLLGPWRVVSRLVELPRQEPGSGHA